MRRRTRGAPRVATAAICAYGPEQRSHFDKMEISFSHPDAVTALLSGSVITAHFASIPFYDQELAHGGTHKVTSSYDILGGPATIRDHGQVH